MQDYITSLAWDICIELPVPPTANDWGQKRRNRWSAKGKRAAERIQAFEWSMLAAIREHDTFVDMPIAEQMHVHIELHHSRIDLDNVRKVLYDALTHTGIIDDDRHIVIDSGRKHRSKRANERLQVMIRLVDDGL